MRIWSLHPRYLDPQGLVALWRETLLARAVLNGQTRGYTRHPQLERFRAHAEPLALVDAYLEAVHREATARGYAFDGSKFVPGCTPAPVEVTEGQVRYEWSHLLRKLQARAPALHERWSAEAPGCHPVFRVTPGPIAAWERDTGGEPAR